MNILSRLSYWLESLTVGGKVIPQAIANMKVVCACPRCRADAWRFAATGLVYDADGRLSANVDVSCQRCAFATSVSVEIPLGKSRDLRISIASEMPGDVSIEDVRPTSYE